MKIPQYLLTYIGFCLKKPNRRFSYLKCQKALKRIGITTTVPNLYKELSLAKQDELVKLHNFYRKEEPVLTSAGYLEIKTRLPFKRFGDWDQKWRIVSISTSTKERFERLQLINLLKKFGFGKLGRNLFISPYSLKTPITRLATNLGIQKYVAFGEIDVLRDEKQEIGAAWDLDEINEKYRTFLKKLRQSPKDDLWPLRAKILEHEFVNIYEVDPHLPTEFLPSNWLGKKAYTKFKELANSY